MGKLQRRLRDTNRMKNAPGGKSALVARRGVGLWWTVGRTSVRQGRLNSALRGFDVLAEEMAMASYKELVAQAEKLMRQAEAARKAEMATAVAEIKAKMAEYGITLADLGGGAKGAKSRKAVAAKYRHPATGDAWSGRGRVPKWLVAELAKGRKREEFLLR